jgi:hypothetical protein
MKVRFFKVAQLELDAGVEYYNVERRGLGYEFLWEVFFAIDRIKQYPNAWQLFEQDARRCLIRRFPYGIIYIHEDDLILIVAIANLHRNPNYWCDRLPE